MPAALPTPRNEHGLGGAALRQTVTQAQEWSAVAAGVAGCQCHLTAVVEMWLHAAARLMAAPLAHMSQHTLGGAFVLQLWVRAAWAERPLQQGSPRARPLRRQPKLPRCSAPHIVAAMGTARPVGGQKQARRSLCAQSCYNVGQPPSQSFWTLLSA